jgi:transforming growth factor-beta-induced protein
MQNVIQRWQRFRDVARKSLAALLIAGAAGLPLAGASAQTEGPQQARRFKVFAPLAQSDYDAGSAAALEVLMTNTGMREMAATRRISFNTLSRALVVSGIAREIVTAKAFTLFAPTDAAFDKLPAGTVESLLKKENKDKLKSLLRYHTLGAKVDAATAKTLDGKTAKTANGEDIAIKVTGDDLFINDARVIAADIGFLGTGLIHVVDGVLIPPSFGGDKPKDIVDTAVAAGNFKTLVAAVQAAGLVDALKAPGPLTVFAPTDAAFEKLPPELIAALLKPENKDKLTEILTYHVLAGKVVAAEALKLDGKEVDTLGGKKIKISVRGGSLFINESKVIAADVMASNGVIHAIDAVLIPPGFVPPSTGPQLKDIVDTAVGAGNFKTLVAAVQAAGLVDALKGPGPLTVFAPTDAAFAKLPPDLIAALLKPENKGKLTEILTYHVIAAKVLAADAKALDGKEAETLGGGKVKISVRNGDLFINESKVVAADVMASNGVIHAIDAVLIPPGFEPPSTPKDIVDTAVAAGTFKTLVAAVQAAELVDALKGPGPFTVFAPSDEAFAKLPPGVIAYLLKPENKAALKSLLLYHVAAGEVKAEQAKTLSNVKTLNGKRAHLSFNGNDLFIEGAKVVAADVEASNGVIHVIDTVLVPNLTLAQMLDASGNFKTFRAAMQAAGLTYLLERDFSAFGGITVFAPTDEAFAKLPAGTVENLVKPENRHTLRRILFWHLGQNVKTGGELVFDGGINTYLGAKLPVKVQNGAVVVGNEPAKVIFADVNAVNGIIHGIDTVMTPPQH